MSTPLVGNADPSFHDAAVFTFEQAELPLTNRSIPAPCAADNRCAVAIFALSVELGQPKTHDILNASDRRKGHQAGKRLAVTEPIGHVEVGQTHDGLELKHEH
jgi:hypothetical protein